MGNTSSQIPGEAIDGHDMAKAEYAELKKEVDFEDMEKDMPDISGIRSSASLSIGAKKDASSDPEHGVRQRKRKRKWSQNSSGIGAEGAINAGGYKLGENNRNHRKRSRKTINDNRASEELRPDVAEGARGLLELRNASADGTGFKTRKKNKYAANTLTQTKTTSEGTNSSAKRLHTDVSDPLLDTLEQLSSKAIDDDILSADEVAVAPDSAIKRLDSLDSENERIRTTLQGYHEIEQSQRDSPQQNDLDHGYNPLADMASDALALQQVDQIISPYRRQLNQDVMMPSESALPKIRYRSKWGLMGLGGSGESDAVGTLSQMRESKAALQVPIDPRISGLEYTDMQIEQLMDQNEESTDYLEQVRPGKLKRTSRKPKRKSESESGPLDNYITRSSEPISDSPALILGPDGSLQPVNASDLVEDGYNPMATPASKRKKRHLPDYSTPADASNADSSQLSGAGSKAYHRHLSKNYNPSMEELKAHGGPFTKEESEKIYAFRDSFCAQHEIDHRQFADKVQANARNVPHLTEFWSDLCDVLPYRGRQATQKFCRRQFHNFAKRGAWTEEDDEDLRQAIALRGKSWKAVGEIMGRMAEDVRDRYRNYIYNSESRNTETWSPEEMKALCRAVGECIYLQIQEKRKQLESDHQQHTAPDEDIDEAEAEKLVIWQVVSDRMGGTRGRLQCSYKWKQLKTANRTGYIKALTEAKQDLDKTRGPRTIQSSNKTWQAEQVEWKVREHLMPGDMRDILETLLDCSADEESKIPWRVLAKDSRVAGRWGFREMKTAWLVRKAQAENVEDLGGKFKDFARSELRKMAEQEGDALVERYAGGVNDPEMANRSNKPAKKKSRKNVVADIEGFPDYGNPNGATIAPMYSIPAKNRANAPHDQASVPVPTSRKSKSGKVKATSKMAKAERNAPTEDNGDGDAENNARQQIPVDDDSSRLGHHLMAYNAELRT